MRPSPGGDKARVARIGAWCAIATPGIACCAEMLGALAISSVSVISAVWMLLRSVLNIILNLSLVFGA